MWYKLHRWISIIATVYLVNMAITGSLLAWDELGYRFGNVAPKGVSPQDFGTVLEPLPDAGLEAAADAVYRVGTQQKPEAPITTIRLNMKDGALIGTVTVAGSPSEQIVIDSRTGTTSAAPPNPFLTLALNNGTPDYHQTLKRLHRGDFFGGYNGRYLSIVAGFCLLFLSISGMVMYVNMLVRRRKMGRGGLFWH